MAMSPNQLARVGPRARERNTLFLFCSDGCAHNCLRNRLSSRPKEQVECRVDLPGPEELKTFHMTFDIREFKLEVQRNMVRLFAP